jgi:sugar lactone lactonase YvrE
LPSKPVSATYVISTPPPTVVNTVAGNGQTDGSGVSGPATDAGLGDPTDVAFDSAGNLYIADSTHNVVWRVDTGTGTINIVAGTLDFINGLNGSGGPATKTKLYGLSHIAIDSADNLYTSEHQLQQIRKVSASTGIISDFAGGGTCCGGYNGDGGPATSAELAYPQGIAFDNAGNLFIADGSNNCIRKVSASTGNISTVAGGGSPMLPNAGDGGLATSATLNNPRNVAIDQQGNLFISELWNGRVRKVTASTGIITTVAGNGNEGSSGDGGPATAAEVSPLGLAFDRANNLYISDAMNSVRMVPVGGGTITRVAGNGFTGFSGDGGSATMASFCRPNGIAFDKAGGLFITDECDLRVRKVWVPNPAATPAFSLPAGTYAGTQTLTITDTTPAAVIYYTTDGSTPSTSSTVYSGPITVSASQTVKAVATATGYTLSGVASAAYVINRPVAVTITWATPAPIPYGTALSSAQLNATTTVAGSFAYSPAAGTVLSAGQHTLQATFTPTDTAHYAAATASVTLTVNAATPTMSAVASSLNPSLVSNSVAFTVSVTSSSGSPTGTITFFDGTTQLGASTLSAGTAAYTTSALAVGSHSITAVYSGDTNFVSLSSGALQQVVETYSIGPSTGGSTSATVSPGGQASYGLSVTPPSTGGAITFSVTGLPPGATATFSPSTIPAGSGPTNVTLTVTVPSSAAALDTDNPFHRGALPAALGLVLLPFAGRLRRTSRRALWLAIVGLAGFTMLGLSACGGGGGGGGGTPTPTPHSYTLTVTAASGSLTQSTTLTLIVK